jgi:Tfp pilus assembly protein PilV
MLTFRLKPWRRDRSATGGSQHDRAPTRGTPTYRSRPALGSQDGFQLIEVMVSALLLGLIAVATFTGLQAVNTNNANQRFHNEAELLAAQSQEALRSDPIGTLEKLVTQANVYSPKVDGTTYTITQSAHELNGSGLSTSCTATEHAAQTAPNFRVTSSVSWHALVGSHPVTESSIITPPTGSSLEVDIDNAPTPTAGVAGVTAVVTYTALESGSPVKLEGTTGSAGCVLFTGIRATSAKVEIDEKPNFVTPSGALKVPAAEVSIAPNLTTHDAVTYNEGGAIDAKYTYQGKTEYNGKHVTGDTFVVSNTEMNLSPELEIGSTAFEPYETGGEEKYTAKTSVYLSQALTAKGAKYTRGDLFPFPSSSWSVYAGDCAANNPLVATSKVVAPGEGLVNAGATTTVEVPMSYVNLEVYKGTEKAPSTLASEIYKVKITNTSCSAASPTPSLPNNAAAVSYIHTQSTTSAGVLENPFQPFGKSELCLQAVSDPPSTTTRKDKIAYLNSTVAGSAFKIYPEEPTAAEKQAAREKEEAAPKEKREKEEAAQTKSREEEVTSKANREKEEAAQKKLREEEPTIKSNREKEEKANKETWEAEEKATHGTKITKAQRETKESEQKTSREASEKSEKATKEKREKEEKVTKETKEKEEATKTSRGKEETAAKETKEKEAATQSSRIKEEEKEATEKKERVEKGTAAAVESGTC